MEHITRFVAFNSLEEYVEYRIHDSLVTVRFKPNPLFYLIIQPLSLPAFVSAMVDKCHFHNLTSVGADYQKIDHLIIDSFWELQSAYTRQQNWLCWQRFHGQLN